MIFLTINYEFKIYLKGCYNMIIMIMIIYNNNNNLISGG